MSEKKLNSDFRLKNKQHISLLFNFYNSTNFYMDTYININPMYKTFKKKKSIKYGIDKMGERDSELLFREFFILAIIL